MNENQENNLNSVNVEATNANPVEQPTVATPEVVEPVQPMASEPVQPVTPVEETPVAPFAPAETPTPAEVVQTVTPVEQAVNPAPSVTPNKKKSNVFIVILLVIVLLGVCGYGVYTYTDLLKPKDKTNENKTTTTTTTAVVNKLAFASVDEYVAAAKEDVGFNTLIIDGDKVLTELDFDLNNKCISDGDKVAFEIGTNKIEYNCKAEYIQDDICENYWSATIKVNDKFTKDFKSCEECAKFSTYVGKNAYIDMLQGACSFSAYNELKVYDLDGKLVEETTYGSFYSTKEDYSDQENIKPIVKDNKFYFIHAEPTSGTNTTCTLKYIDLDASNPTIVDSGISTSCTIDE